MFEGLLGNDMDVYVTTAANAVESSWATYCPSFGGGGDDGAVAGAAAAADGGVADGSGSGGSLLLRGLVQLKQRLQRLMGSPPASAPHDASGSGATPPMPPPQPTPQFSTCLGDLYSVAWMEDAERADLTAETLLQQYKAVKVRQWRVQLLRGVCCVLCARALR
jgi:hypothetical protein